MDTALCQFEDAAAGLAFEYALFMAEGPQVGIWSAKTRGLVCPRAYESRRGFAAAIQRAHDTGWPVHLRPTGGGTVPQGPGIENVVMAFDAWPDSTIDDAYRLLTRILQRGLGANGAALSPGDTPGSFCDGAWNLSVRGCKVVGTAQRWRPRKSAPARVLAHAVVLTTERFRPGASAVAAFHDDLGLDPVRTEAHTSLETAFDLCALPAEVIIDVAHTELAARGNRD